LLVTILGMLRTSSIFPCARADAKIGARCDPLRELLLNLLGDTFGDDGGAFGEGGGGGFANFGGDLEILFCGFSFGRLVGLDTAAVVVVGGGFGDAEPGDAVDCAERGGAFGEVDPEDNAVESFDTSVGGGDTFGQGAATVGGGDIFGPGDTACSLALEADSDSSGSGCIMAGDPFIEEAPFLASSFPVSLVGSIRFRVVSWRFSVEKAGPGLLWASESESRMEIVSAGVVGLAG
jgi:hypothetical protein